MVLEAVAPVVHGELGAFIALIVVNCMILGRQEAFASKRPVGKALLDALGTSVGFTIALVMMGAFREILGYGSFFGLPLFGPNYEPWVVMISPPGGFFTLGFILLFLGWLEERRAKAREIRHWPHSVKVPVKKEAA
jgi:electron transport complex protein RnfE